MKLRGITEVCMEFLLYAAGVLASAAASYASIEVYCRLPSEWLCDYHEIPGPEHLPGNRCRNRKAAFLLLWIFCAVLHFLTFREKYDSFEMVCREFFLLTWFIILVTAALSDIDYMIIPDQCCAAALLPAVLRMVWELHPEMTARAVRSAFFSTAGGALLAGVLMASSMLLGRAAAGAESIGMGDLKLITVCGACIGAVFPETWSDAVLVFFVIAVMINAVRSAALLALRRIKYGDRLPFGPWISAAALFCISLG